MTADTPAASKDAPTDEVVKAAMARVLDPGEDMPVNDPWPFNVLLDAYVGLRADGLALAAHVAALTTQLEAERAEKAQWVEALKDPAAVRLNILRGGIAKPEWRSMLDLYDEKLEQWDRLMEAVNYIAQHDNSGLTDGSGATRQCIDRLVEIARNAVDSKFEADLTTRLSAETARADKAEAEAKALREALEDGYKMLARAFNRIHALPRSSDTALAEQICQTRARIETALARAAIAAALKEMGAG